MSNNLEIEDSGNVRLVRFIRPEIRNPLSVAVLAELEQVVHACESSVTVKRLIFTGTANVFASGADLREIAQVTAEQSTAFALRGQRLMAAIAAVPQTTIAAINGFCFGGALDLALACDVRIASPEARFAHPGAGLGIITGWGGTQRLPRLIGQARAFEMFFTAEAIVAQTALEVGLLHELCADPVRNAIELIVDE